MLTIQRKISTVNYSKGNNPLYIVIHDVGALGQALANVNYFYNVYRGASAHYFVDDYNIMQSVEDFNVGWHVGDDKDDSDDGINNYNSIGIEMCLNPSWKVNEATKQNTIDLVKHLQAKHNIPNSRVVRHFDASGKNCPGSMSANGWAEWKAFYARICGTSGQVIVNATSTNGIHTVVIGDTLWKVAKNNGMSVESLKSLNGLTSNTLRIGQVLKTKGSGTIIQTPAPAPVVPVTNKINWINESGTFYPNKTLNVRTEPNDKATIVAQYHAGQSVKYNAKYEDGYYTWIRYTGGSGLSRYMVSKINGVKQGQAH